MADNSDHHDDARRSCPKCNTRMSSLFYDKHSICYSCRKTECNIDKKCTECSLWSDDEFARFIKHKKSLDSKSKNRKAKKSEEGLARASSSESVVSPSGAENLSSRASLDESRILELISSQMNVFAKSFASSMENSFIQLDNRIDEKIACSNRSLADHSPQAPVQPPLSQGQPDPSCLTPQMRYGNLGGERIESEPAALANSPPEFSDFFSKARAAGLEVPEGLVGRILLAGPDAAGSAAAAPQRIRPGSVSEGQLGVGVDAVVHGRAQPPAVALGLSQGAGSVAGIDSSVVGLSGSQSAGLGLGAAAAVNVGASTSGMSRSATHSVSFADAEFADPSEPEDRDSERASQESFKSVLKLLFQLCPDAEPDAQPPALKACAFEGIFAHAARHKKEESAAKLFHRVAELLQEARVKFSDAAESGKLPCACLPGRRKMYGASDAPELQKAAPPNKSLARFVSVSGKRAINMSIEETAKVEVVLKSCLESQSISFWLFNALLCWLKELGLEPPAPALFDQLIQSFSLSMVSSTSMSAALATFMQAKRREAYLSHFPPHVAAHFKAQLAASDFSSSGLFDEDTLASVLAATREDSQLEAQLAMAKAFSFPVFGKAIKKAADPSASASASAPAQRGKGRGAGKGYKRKASASPGRGRGYKSPRGGASASSSAPSSGRPAAGQGFQK